MCALISELPSNISTIALCEQVLFIFIWQLTVEWTKLLGNTVQFVAALILTHPFSFAPVIFTKNVYLNLALFY